MSSNLTVGCAICNNAFIDTDAACATLCGHTYHRNCLFRWFQTRRDQNLRENCPTCRATTNLSRVISLYLHQVGNQSLGTSSETEELDFDMHSIQSRETSPNRSNDPIVLDSSNDSIALDNSDAETELFSDDSVQLSSFQGDVPFEAEDVPSIDSDHELSLNMSFSSPEANSVHSFFSDVSSIDGEAMFQSPLASIVIEDSDLEDEIERDRERRVEMNRQLQNIVSGANGVDNRLERSLDMLNEMRNRIETLRSSLSFI